MVEVAMKKELVDDTLETKILIQKSEFDYRNLLFHGDFYYCCYKGITIISL